MIDEKQPSCSQCERQGRTCPGPQSTTKFVNEFARERTRAQTSTKSSSSPEKSRESTPAESTAVALREPQKLPKVPTWPEECPSPVTWDLHLPVEVYYINLLVNKFNVGTPGDGKGFSWLRLGLEDTKDKEFNLAHSFTKNLAQSFFGHFYKLPEVVAQAQVAYGKHLSVLQKELNVPGSVGRQQLFRGIVAAVLYECIALTSLEGWRMHTSALARILEVSIHSLYRYLAYE